jgi:hypothetical protein
LKHSVDDDDVIANKIGVFIKHWIHLCSDPNVPNIYKFIDAVIEKKYKSRRKLYNSLKKVWLGKKNDAFCLPKSYDRVPQLNFETLYEMCKKDIQQQMTQNQEKLTNWYSEIDNLLLSSEIECVNLSGMNVFMREMSWYIIYTTIKRANEIQKFNSHTKWMILYAIRKFQAITKKDVRKICQDIINIIFTSQGEAINNDMVMNWLKNEKTISLFDIINDQMRISQTHNLTTTTPVAVAVVSQKIKAYDKL